MAVDSMLASERLAAHVAGLRYTDLPLAAVAAAKIFVLDTLGVAVSGSTADGMAALRTTAARWGAGTEATVWGTGLRAPAPTAVLLNATAVHNQEFDCVHEGAVVHAMATLLPALLAFAERAGAERAGVVSGRDLITAVAAGVDVAAGLGLASTGEFRFFRPAVAGGFGAAAGCAKLAGLSAPRIVDAFGIQYGQTSGTMQPHVEGNIVLPMQIGFNARAAFSSVDLAAAGLPGPRDVFEGRYGYFRLIEGSWDITRIWRFLGQEFQVCNLSHKPYPAGRATHGGIEGILALRAQHAIVPDEVAEVRVIGPPLINRLVGRADIPAPNAFYARLCMAFMGATALRHGRVDIADCRGHALADAATHALAQRITMQVDDNVDPNALAPQRVTIRMRDGLVHEWQCTEMLANPARPLNREQQLQKFHRCWEFADTKLGPAEELVDLVDRLEDVADVRALIALLAPPG